MNEKSLILLDESGTAIETVPDYDEKWDLYEEELDGFPARVVQHEYDHIEGILFLDHINPFRRSLLKGKLNDISRGDVDVSYRMRFPR